jgi:hypothetical protein
MRDLMDEVYDYMTNYNICFSDALNLVSQNIEKEAQLLDEISNIKETFCDKFEREAKAEEADKI